MRILKVGDTGKAICEHCKDLVDVTYQLRDVPFSDHSGTAKDILAGVCVHCESVVSIPHQSVPAIKRELEKPKAVEGRVPPHIIDILNVASDTLGGNTSSVASILKYYIHALSHQEFSSKNLTKLLESDLAQGRAVKRISLKGQYIAEDIEAIKALTHIKATTDILKGVALKINDDVLVHKRRGPIKQLQRLIVANS